MYLLVFQEEEFAIKQLSHINMIGMLHLPQPLRFINTDFVTGIGLLRIGLFLLIYIVL